MEGESLKDLQLEKQPVFDSQDGCVYRIPALFYNKNNQKCLAFAEKRKTLDDSTADKLVMRTGELKISNIQWSEVKEVEKAYISGFRTMNPCPVYEEKGKKLFLFFICVENYCTEQWQIDHCCNKARLCYITTTDDGKTWSELTDLTSKLQEIGEWATFAVGPGHGLQTKSGRLIVPVHAYPIQQGSCCSKGYASASYAVALYTDDPNEEWHFGNMLQTKSGECQMVELVDDKQKSIVYCNARSKSGHREEAVSENDGVDFSILARSNESEKLVDNGCHGSVVSFPAQNKDATPEENTWLLFTHTTDRTNRIKLGVYLNKSPQYPDKWSKPWIINSGTSAYTDLVCIGDGRFVCLMERGDHKEINQIASVVFSYSQLEQGIGQ